MAEIKFCIKSLIAAVAIVLCLQIQVSGRSIEDYSNQWMHSSSVPIYLQKVADGGALALRNTKKAAQNFYGHAFSKVESEYQKASR